MSVGVIENPLGGDSLLNTSMERNQQSGRRRVFVQTETGRIDNARTLKRRLQLALNLPAEENSLTFGDMVLENDLSPVRNDSPLLLSRNLLRMSSSTPSLSLERDLSRIIKILAPSDRLHEVKQLVRDCVKAIKMGVVPLPVDGGSGGVYCFRNSRGERVAIVKPTDEEPYAPNNPKGRVGKTLGQSGGIIASVRVGESGFREVAAFLLDHDHSADVPPTALVKITHWVFNVNDGVNGSDSQKKTQVTKIASFQQFIPDYSAAADFGSLLFSDSDVHRIGILDIRIFNADRHTGNLLFGEHRRELIPIDHGLCLPETLENPRFEWLSWRQAWKPLSGDELEYIKKLNPQADCDMLRAELPMIRKACLRILVLCTVFLQEAASDGLCLAEIGEMMTRKIATGEEEPSELEVVCIEARRRIVAEREVVSSRSERGDDEFQFDLDCNDTENGFHTNLSSGHGSANEQLPASVSFVRLADISEEEWFPFLEIFKDLL